MSFAALTFLNPWLLAGLITLPAIYWLLRAVPPRPAQVSFPPTRILVGLENKEKTADKTPWWLTLIRLLAAAFVIFALADPVLNPNKSAALKGTGPVAIVVDNGWSSATHWATRANLIARLISEAEADNRTAIIVPTAGLETSRALKVEAPVDARTTAAALQPRPFAPDRGAALTALQSTLAEDSSGSASVIWVHDGLDHDAATAAFIDGLIKLTDGGSIAMVDQADGEGALGLTAQSGENGRLEAIVLSAGGDPTTGTIYALSARGERLGEAAFTLSKGETRATIAFDLPLELRNQVARITLASERSAGAVSLIDAATQWHRIGLISGESREKAQPLLAPLYYIQRALQPYAELAISRDSNLEIGLQSVLQQNVSALMMADIGTLNADVANDVAKFVERGGLLVRFAGPRLERGGDDLLPVSLRAGGRSMGGALSWSAPQALAAFEDTSPFAGLTIPADVAVTRQVLADPAQLGNDVEIWARLSDGTPLVTATKRGDGRIVLFHVTANSDWSNLPISGLFVDMLRRLATMGRIGASGTQTSTDDAAATTADDVAAGAKSATPAVDQTAMLPPLKTLDGFGALVAPPPTAEPVKAALFSALQPSRDHPPGYYGGSANPKALNVLTAKSELKPITNIPTSVSRLNYDNAASTSLKPWLLALALTLLFADIIAILALQAGGLKALAHPRQRAATTSGLAVIVSLGAIAATAFVATLAATSTPARAQSYYDNPYAAAAKPQRPAGLSAEETQALDATAKVTFAYVYSGNVETDTTSRVGLQGLGRVLQSRTAVEPGEPVGIDILKDEIGFYPILYWPVLENAETLPDKAIAKIDAYMKEGGLIVFDTRDYGKGGSNALAIGGPGGTALQRLLGKLDVPRLEPVPENHVLTKSFYLLKSFPGRWDGGQLWVEAISDLDDGSNRARVADGVTSIMVSSNDLAAAWALDERGRPMYPVVPGGEMQREMAFRAGVNIVMHALTGNYKADQVHVPALLQRLGQ